MTLQIVTANRLVDGVEVYLTDGGVWSEAFTDSLILRSDPEAEAAMKDAARAVAEQHIVGPYLAEVRQTEDGIEPTSARERIRAAHRPTIVADAGSWTQRIEG